MPSRCHTTKKSTNIKFVGRAIRLLVWPDGHQIGQEPVMIGKTFGLGPLVVAGACLAIAADTPRTALAQQGAAPKNARAKRVRAKKSVAKPISRPKEDTAADTVADLIILRDGKHLLGQLVDLPNDGLVTILARRDLVRKTLPTWAGAWEAAEKNTIAAALKQRHERLAAWRRERPAGLAAGDRVTTWLDRELSRDAGMAAQPALMAIRLNRDDVSAIERRSDSAAQVLRAAWVLGLADPETVAPATLKKLIADRGMNLTDDASILIDRLLPPLLEREDHWLLRRAATEALNDNGLRFIGFGSNILPEPIPGQPIDPSAGMALVEGVIRDALGAAHVGSLPLGIGNLAARGRSMLPIPVPGNALDLAPGARVAEGAVRGALGAGAADPLQLKLGAVASRGQAGMILTRIVLAADLASASAESTLFYYNGSNWDRAVWRSQTLEVGSVPPIVSKLVGADPQVKAVMNFINSIGAGFVTPEMNERGLAVGTTVGGAVVLARTALIKALTELAFDVEGKPTRTTQ
jgi:hypothetical protein